MRSFLYILALCLMITTPSETFGQDARGSADHPIITRYPGQMITRYEMKEFDQYNLVLGIARNRPSDVRQLEGKVTRIMYKNPPNRSTLEILRNFENALRRSGAQILFNCAGDACGFIANWYPVNGIRSMGYSRDNQYTASRATKSGSGIYISVFVGTSSTQVDVIEVKEMEGGLVSVNSDALKADIERDGHVAVYEILFDTGKATLKPESESVIGEIARMLSDQPHLRLHVVGHTDGTGAFDMNMKLSSDRAQAVVQSLITRHGVATSRLNAHGVGPLAPVSSNATEDGREKNRRVELVAQ